MPVAKKVIYVSYVPLTESISKERYIDFLLSRGVSVEYWDVTGLIRDEFQEHHKITTNYLRIPRTYQELEEMVRAPENKDASYIMMVTYEGRFTRLFRVLSKYNCRMMQFLWAAMPETPIPKSQRIGALLLKPLTLAKRFYYRVKASLYRKLGLVKPFDIIFAAGRVLMSKQHFAVKIVPINNCDYDYFHDLQMKEGPLVLGRYAVFLDTNLAYHSDLEICGWPKVNASNYFASVNRFFTLLEKEHGVKVVIAAHPKSNYSEETFQGRPIYRNRTLELTKGAEFVLAHTSTSQSYAVLNSIPVIYIYTTEMMQIYRYTMMKEISDFANYFGAPMYNVDEITKGAQIVIPEVPARRYEDYKYDFLTSRESEQMTTRDIFWREISS